MKSLMLLVVLVSIFASVASQAVVASFCKPTQVTTRGGMGLYPLRCYNNGVKDFVFVGQVICEKNRAFWVIQQVNPGSVTLQNFQTAANNRLMKTVQDLTYRKKPFKIWYTACSKGSNNIYKVIEYVESYNHNKF